MLLSVFFFSHSPIFNTQGNRNDKQRLQTRCFWGSICTGNRGARRNKAKAGDVWGRETRRRSQGFRRMWVYCLPFSVQPWELYLLSLLPACWLRCPCIPFRFSIQDERRDFGSDVEQERGRRATNRVTSDYPREYLFKNGVYVPNTQY